MHRGRDRCDDPLCDLSRFRSYGAGQQHGELVPAQTCDQVAGMSGPTNARRNLLEQIVTRTVAEHIVHILEVVEVDEKDGRAARWPIVEGRHQTGVEGRPVGQPGKGVQRGL